MPSVARKVSETALFLLQVNGFELSNQEQLPFFRAAVFALLRQCTAAVSQTGLHPPESSTHSSSRATDATARSAHTTAGAVAAGVAAFVSAAGAA